MYRPNSWSGLAEAIAAAEIGDGRKLAELSGAGGANWDAHVRNITDAQRAMEAGWGPDREMGQSEAGMAVSCGDAPPFEVGGDQDTEAWTKVWMGWRDQVQGFFLNVYFPKVLSSPPRTGLADQAGLKESFAADTGGVCNLLRTDIRGHGQWARIYKNPSMLQ
jgi:hypothetical protein